MFNRFIAEKIMILLPSLLWLFPHLLIDAVILSAALTITLVLRAKGNAARKEKEIKWLQKKKKKNLKNLNF